MDSELLSFFVSIGLTKTEANIYYCGLSDAQIGVKELVDRTNIKRTTIYHCLGTLRQKGLVSESRDNGKLVYVMARSESIDRFLQRQISKLEQQKLKLASIERSLPKVKVKQSDDWAIEHYTGREGVELAIDTALYCKDRCWKIIAPTNNYFSHSDKNSQKYFLKTRENRHIIAKSLWEETFHPKKSSVENRAPRILPSSFNGKFKSTIILFDNSILMLSSGKTHSAVILKSTELFSTLSVMFDGLYLISKPYELIK